MTHPMLEYARSVAKRATVTDRATGDTFSVYAMHAGPITSDGDERHILVEIADNDEAVIGFYLSSDDARILAESLNDMAHLASFYIPREKR